MNYFTATSNFLFKRLCIIPQNRCSVTVRLPHTAKRMWLQGHERNFEPCAD